MDILTYALCKKLNGNGSGVGVAIDQTLTHEGKAADAKTVGDRLNELSEENAKLKSDVAALSQTIIGKNLFNKDNVTVGALLSSGEVSLAGSYANYITSEFIEVNPGDVYTMAYVFEDGRLASTARLIYLLFNADKLPITETYSNTNSVGTVTFSVDDAAYLRVSFSNNGELGSKYGQLEIGESYTAYEPYAEKTYVNMDVPAEKLPFTDVLHGKKWVVCGDSFTGGATSSVLQSGKYEGREKVYPYYIGNRTGIEVIKFFAGGKTLAFPEVPGDFINSITCPESETYYQNIPVDADYITIYLGINDGHHETGSSGTDGEDVTGVITLGTIDDEDTSTYYGAWNVVLTWLIENRPFAHIGIIVSNGVREAYRVAQLDIAKKYCVPYIDMNGDERTPCMIRSANSNIDLAVREMITRKQAVDYDGSITGSVNRHPNDETHEYESYFIENFLRSI